MCDYPKLGLGLYTLKNFLLNNLKLVSDIDSKINFVGYLTFTKNARS